MNVLNEIKNRRSIRKYKDTQVKDEDVLQIIEAGRLAPSGSNTQPWRFIIVKDKEMRKLITKADHNQEWMLTAPVFLVCLTDISCRINEPKDLCCDEDCSEAELKRAIRDTSVALGYMLLEAEHIGLGTCWTGWYEQKDIKRVLNLPDYIYVNGIITLGYADETPAPRPRRTIDEIVYYEKWL